MMAYLKNALWILLLVAALSAIGLSIEWFRRRGLQKWALAQGGTFEAGGILKGVDVPEAAPFEGTSEEKPTYHNVTRIEEKGTSIVLAQYHQTYKDIQNNVKSVSHVVCFISLPGADWPAVEVYPPFRSALLPGLAPERPAPLAIKEASPAFAAAFEVRALSGTAPEAPARLLPAAVQEELLANEGLIHGLQARGRTVRVQAVGRPTGYPHQEVHAVAKRLAAAWADQSPAK